MRQKTILSVAAGCAIGMWFSVVTVQAQGGGQAPQAPPSSGSGGGSRGTAPSPSPSPSPSTPTPSPLPGSRDRQQIPGVEQERTPFPEIRRPIFLSGKVVMEDGTPPPDSVVIERMCNGVVRPEGYTDSKGRFSIELGRNNMMMADASVGSMNNDMGIGSPGGSRTQRGGIGSMGGDQGGYSPRDLMGCELRASLPGYRSEVVNLSGRRLFDNPDVGVIILRRLANVEGSTISLTSLKAPKDAKKAFEKGRKALDKRKWEQAEKELQRSVGIYPQYAAAWFELGRAFQQQDKVNEARNAYSKAVEADAKFVNPYLQLADLAVREQKWQEVIDTTNRIVKLDPVDFPVAYFYNSVANYQLRNFEAAEDSAREALKLDKQHRIPKVNHVLGVILAQKGDFSEAAQQMKSYLQFAPNANDADVVKKQLAEVESMLGGGAGARVQPQQ
jgi:tetratricopeptide (TPR) repeat protein